MEIVFHKEIFFEIFIYGRKVEDLLEKKEKASVKLNFDKIKKVFIMIFQIVANSTE